MLKEWAIEGFWEDKQYLVIVIHKVHNIWQKFIPGPLLSKGDWNGG